MIRNEETSESLAPAEASTDRSRPTSFTKVRTALEIIAGRKSRAQAAIDHGVREDTIDAWVAQATPLRGLVATVTDSPIEPRAGGTASPYLDGIATALVFAERIRDSVLDDLKHRDSLAVKDHVYELVLERLRENEDIGRIASREVNARVGKLGAVAGAVILIFGFFGLSNLSSYSEDAARREVETRLKTEVPAAVDSHIHNIKVETEAFERRLDKAEERMRTIRDEASTTLNASVQDATGRILRVSESTVAGLAERVREETGPMFEAVKSAKAEIARQSESEITTLQKTGERLRDELREQYAFLRNKLTNDRVSSVSRTGEEAGSSPTTNVFGSPIRIPELERDLAQALIFRDYQACLELAQRAASLSHWTLVRTALHDHMNAPEKFTRDDMLRAAELIRLPTGVSPKDWSIEEYQERLELAIALFRGGYTDEAATEIELVMRSAFGNIRNHWELFVEAAIIKKPAERVGEAWKDAKQGDGLTARGLANSLFLLKSAGCDDELIRDVQQRLIDSVERDTIAEFDASDYGFAYLVASTLMKEPVFTTEATRDVVRQIMRRIFPSRSLNESGKPENDPLGIYPSLLDFVNEG